MGTFSFGFLVFTGIDRESGPFVSRPRQFFQSVAAAALPFGKLAIGFLIFLPYNGG
jgi:hypothetical protein